MADNYQKNLSRIPDLDERKLLRDLLNSVFDGVLEYDREMFQRVEDKVFHEIEYKEMRYSICTTLVTKEDYDPIHDYLFPMRQADVSTEMESAFPEEGAAGLCLEKIFIEADYLKLKKILAEKTKYKGKIYTERAEYEIVVHLEADREYLELIKQLYEGFISNSIPWTTLNCPYIFKFVDCIIEHCVPAPQPEEKIVRFEIEFGELEKLIQRGMIPLWNVQKLQANTVSFPVPVHDGINYEHIISAVKFGEESGFLIEMPKNINCYMNQTKDMLTVIAPIENIIDWNLMRIVKKPTEETRNGNYRIMTNRTINSFINRLESSRVVAVRTKGELARVLHSFEAVQEFEFLEVSILDTPPEQVETYSMDFFLADGIREEKYKKCMLLTFRKKEAPGVFDRDCLSFLVSVVQGLFPEYFCVGSLKEEKKK